jgi:2-polyprenyl-3-methyl-5-hydroxy-6-metoxy-1,4-benzoquinol methylase
MPANLAPSLLNHFPVRELVERCVGAGVGFFSQTLLECGLNVCGIEGRAENVSEARKRFPHIPFGQADIQERSTLELGKFDLVLCFGLLYHLENPLLAIRNLHALTGKCLLLESMCIVSIPMPSALPTCCATIINATKLSTAS